MTKQQPFRRKIRAQWLPFILKGFSWIPLKGLYAIASVIGWFLYYFPNSIKKIAIRNIELCFPEKTEVEKKAFLKKVLRHNAATIFELSFTWLKPLETIKRSINKILKDQNFEEDLSNHSQMLFITPHLGSWEISGLYASSLYPLVTMYRPSRLGIDEIIIKGRSKNGAILVPTTAQGVRDMIRAIKEGRSVGILPDQDPGKGEGLFSDFFGIQTKTIVLVSRLAQKFKLPVYLLATTRDMKTAQFTIHTKRIDDAIMGHDLQHSVDVLNKAVEEIIRTQPEQYLWTYKRFKTAPPNEPARYND